jgi:Na+-translocating ferredoxin:NAD+ oxidoreductase RnfA subunit
MSERRGTSERVKAAPAARGGPRPVFVPVLVTNAGVLVVLLFGPNSQHPIAPLTYGGVAAAVIGLVFIVRHLVARNRNASYVPPARGR